MRADMAKVIVERPRFGSRARGKPKGCRRAQRRLGDEDPPAREAMKGRCRGRPKGLNEHLGPLRRYLDSQVGRPWDQVFSEICARIDRSSAVQDHVRDHIRGYVATHVLLIDGVPCSGEGGPNYGRPLSERLPWRRWYVCPRTGLLRRMAAPRRERPCPRPAQRPRYVPVSDSLLCKFLDGAWHLVTVKPLPLPRYLERQRDVVLDRAVADLTPALARKHYGAAVYAVAKRRLSRKELAQLPVPMALWG